MNCMLSASHRCARSLPTSSSRIRPHVGQCSWVVRSMDNQGEELSDEMKKDLERLRKAQAMSKNRFEPIERKPEPPATPLENVKDFVDKILIADFFFVLVIMVWLGVGVAVNEAHPEVYLTWTSLWTPVFQPAIGILMAGALGSGLIGYVAENMMPGGNKQ